MTDSSSGTAVAVSLHHIQIEMPPGKEDQARAFYADLLGLTETPKPARLAGRGGCWFLGDDLELHIGVDEDFRPARKAHPAFRVRGLAALRTKFEEAGIESVDGTQLEGHERFYAYDPFGNRLELIEESSRG